MHKTNTHTTYAAAHCDKHISYISTMTDIRSSLTTKILWVGKVRSVVKRGEARSTQNVSLKKSNSHANNRENIRVKKILRSKHHLVIRIRNPAVHIQAAPAREHGPCGGVRVLGVDTIWRNVIQHTALRRLGKHRRKPFFGFLVTNRFTIRAHVPQEVFAACCVQNVTQNIISRDYAMECCDANTIMHGGSPGGCARWVAAHAPDAQGGQREPGCDWHAGNMARSRAAGTWNYA